MASTMERLKRPNRFFLGHELFAQAKLVISVQRRNNTPDQPSQLTSGTVVQRCARSYHVRTA